jgi:uncharacterized protein
VIGVVGGKPLLSAKIRLWQCKLIHLYNKPENKMNIQVSKERIAEFCQKWKIVELSFFGSVLREDFRPDSDVDVLVTFAPDRCYSLFDLVHMEEELEKLLGRKVDLVERRAIEQSENYIRRKHILNSAQAIYVA